MSVYSLGTLSSEDTAERMAVTFTKHELYKYFLLLLLLPMSPRVL